VQDPGHPAGSIPEGATTWTYDERGLPKDRTTLNGNRTTVTFDRAGRFLQARHLSPTSTELERAYLTYDEVGNPKTRDMAGGKYTWTYDVLNQLETEHLPGQPYRTTWTYDYARGRETERTGSGVKTWTYDAADQVSKVETAGAATVTYSYDQDGNRTLRNDGNRTT
jgi:YD repeat-containing protein